MKDFMQANQLTNAKKFIQFSDAVREFYTYNKDGLAKIDLTVTQARTLHVLSDFEGMSQQDAKRFLAVSSSTLSEMITVLEKKEFVIRKINKENRRFTLIYLTEKGQKVMTELNRLFEEYCSKMTKKMTQDEVEIFEQLLNKLTLSNKIEK
ncbi:MarR family winged helix-turn-helix transcriptional regulator [Enterococcus phoeniculicola]|nr:MarR family transcriptional regulator [Enterococcus phoeniculicola]